MEEAEGFGFPGHPDMAGSPTRGQALVLRTGKAGGEWGVGGEADAGEGAMWGLRVCFTPKKAITGDCLGEPSGVTTRRGTS